MTYLFATRNDRVVVLVLRDRTTAVLVAQHQAAFIALGKAARSKLDRVLRARQAAFFDTTDDAKKRYDERAELRRRESGYSRQTQKAICEK